MDLLYLIDPHGSLTANRLFGWHAALFPTGYSSLTKIRIGQGAVLATLGWRADE
jgi:hypothetical protein